MKFKLNIKKIILIITLTFSICLVILLINTFYINSFSSLLVYKDVIKVPKKEVGIVLGAFVYSDGTLSGMLKDRCDSAVELYKLGKINKILVTGDHGKKDYDEVNSMKNYLLKFDVKPEDVFTDYAGFDTYDSLYRAKNIFGVESAIVITQKFHLGRSIYIASSLGIETVGFIADRSYYGSTLSNEIREIFSNFKASFELLIGSKPKFLGDKILIDGDGRLSWD